MSFGKTYGPTGGSNMQNAASAYFNNKQKQEQETAYQQNLSQPEPAQKWYAGEKPTRREYVGKIMSLYGEGDPKYQEALNYYRTSQATPGTDWYQPYTQVTNSAVASLEALGVDTTGIDTDEWFTQNAYMQSWFTSNDGSNEVKKPGKGATAEEWAGYYYRQAYKQKDLTNKSRTEWDALQQELTYKTQNPYRNSTDQEIIDSIDWSKYPTLVAMDKGRDAGVPLELNAKSDYCRDALEGVIWAARNPNGQGGYGTGNTELNMAYSAMGVGNQYQPNQKLRDKLDPVNPAYSPYSVGPAGNDANALCLYFGVYELTPQWVKENENLLNSTDATKKNNYIKAANIVSYTEGLNNSLQIMNDSIDYLLEQGSDADKIIKRIFDDGYVAPGLDPTGEVDYKDLFALDETMTGDRNRGEPKNTGYAIDYKRSEMEARIRQKQEELERKKTEYVQGETGTDAKDFQRGQKNLGKTSGAIVDYGSESDRRVLKCGIHGPIAAELMTGKANAVPNPEKLHEAGKKTLDSLALATWQNARNADNIEKAQANIDEMNAANVALGVESRFNNMMDAMGVDQEKREDYREMLDQMGNTEAFNAIRNNWDQAEFMRTITPESYANGTDVYSDTRLNFQGLSSEAAMDAADAVGEINETLAYLSDNPENMRALLELYSEYMDLQGYISGEGEYYPEAGQDALIDMLMGRYDGENGEDELEKARMLRDVLMADKTAADEVLGLGNASYYLEGAEKQKRNDAEIAYNEQAIAGFEDQMAQYVRQLKQAPMAVSMYEQDGTKYSGDTMSMVGDIYDIVNSDLPPKEWDSYSVFDLMEKAYNDSNGAEGMSRKDVTSYARYIATNNPVEIRRIQETVKFLQDQGFVFPEIDMQKINRKIEDLTTEARQASYYLLDDQKDFDAVVQQTKAAAANNAYGKTARWMTDGKNYHDIEEWFETFVDVKTNGASKTYTKTDIYNALEKQDIDRYFYILGTDGKNAANKYLQDLINSDNGIITTRRDEKKKQEAYEFASKNGWTALLATAGSLVTKVPAAINEFVYRKAMEIQGKEINPHAEAYMWSTLTGSLREGSKERFATDVSNLLSGINSETFSKENVQKVTDFLYDMAISGAADSAINGLITSAGLGVIADMVPFGSKIGQAIAYIEGGGMGSLASGALKITSDFIHAAPMGLGAAESAYRDAVLKGATPEQAEKMATMTFFAETLSEAITFSNMKGMLEAGQTKEVKAVIMELLGDSLEEAFGEGMNELVEQHFDREIMGAESEWAANYQSYIDAGYSPTMASEMADREMWNGVMKAALSGAMSSWLTGGVSYFAGRHGNTSLGRAVTSRGLGTVTELIQAGLSDSTDISTFDLASQLGRDLAEGNKLSRNKVGQLTKALMSSSNESVRAMVDNALNNRNLGARSEAVPVDETEAPDWYDQSKELAMLLEASSDTGNTGAGVTNIGAVLAGQGFNSGLSTSEALATAQTMVTKVAGGDTQAAAQTMSGLIQNAAETVAKRTAPAAETVETNQGITSELLTETANTSNQNTETVGNDVAEANDLADAAERVAQTKRDVSFATMTDGAANAALTGIVESVKAGNDITAEDVRLLHDAVLADQEGENGAAMQESYAKAVLDNRISNRITEKMSTDEVTKEFEDEDKKVEQARINLDAAQKAFDEAVAKAQTASQNVAALANEDLGKTDMNQVVQNVIGQQQSALNEQEAAKSQLEVQQQKNTDVQKEAEENKSRIFDRIYDEARAEVTQEMAQEQEAARQAQIENAAKEIARQKAQERADLAESVHNGEVEQMIEEAFPNISEEDKATVREIAKTVRGEIAQEAAATAIDIEDMASAEELLNRGKLLNQIAKKIGVQIKVLDTVADQGFFSDGYFDPDTNTLVLDNKTAVGKAIFDKILPHELTHIAEKAGMYNELANTLLKQKYGQDADYASAIAAMNNGDMSSQLAQDILTKKQQYERQLKKNVSFEYALQEIVADQMGEVVHGNPEVINRLAQEEPSTLRRIIDSIKNFMKRMVGMKGSVMTDAQKTVDMLEKALVQAQTARFNEAREAGKRFSLPEAIENVYDDMTTDELWSLLDLDENETEEDAREIMTVAVKDIVNEFDPTIYNGKLYVKPETMDYWLSGSGFASTNPNYAQAYITTMNPADFLRLTTVSEYGQNRILNEATRLDGGKLSENAKRQPIQLSIDEATGKITGHEGRHRAVALARAGVTEMPVLLFDMGTKYSKTAKDSMTLDGQDYGDNINGNQITFQNVIPLNNANRDAIIAQYTPSDETEANAALNGQRVLKYHLSDVAQPIAASPDGGVTAEQLPSGTITLDTLGDRKFSLSSFNKEEQDRVREALYNAKDKNGRRMFTRKQVDNYLENALGVAAYIAKNKQRLDFIASDNQVFLKLNNDYYFTLDASTLCAKRLLYQGTFDYVQHALPDEVFTPEDLIDLVNIMNEMGYETPCGICYVESRRRWLDTYANEFLETVPKDPKSFVDKRFKKASDEEKAALIERLSGEMPSIDDLTTSDGLERLRNNDPLMHKAFVAAMNAKGTANPKVVQLRTEYRGDIGKLSAKDIQKVKDIGGLRIQSFSDFETPHLLDMMQAVMDMASVGLTSQAYTKVPNFAWVFGDTGIKINLSLIGKGTGLDENGNLVFDNREGIDFDEAMKLRERYNQNVGTILVGINDEHIIAAMGDPRIDFIIPFHKSGWSSEELRKMPTLNNYNDYTDTQNERLIIRRNEDGSFETESFQKHKERTKESLENFQPVGKNGYWNFNKSGQWNAENYLKMCAEQHRMPKFWQFLVDNGDGSFSLPQGTDKRSTSIREGYWKTLIDFKMYENDSYGRTKEDGTKTKVKKAEQQTVKPNINMDQAYRVMDEYRLGRQMPDKEDGTPGRFIPMENNNSVPVAIPAAEEYIETIKRKREGIKPEGPGPNALEADLPSDASTRSYNPMAATAFAAMGMDATQGNTETTEQEFAQSGQAALAINPETGETERVKWHLPEDAPYMAAVERGEMDEAQRMVEEAAKEAFPDSKLIQNGVFHKMWHHTNNEFTEFLPAEKEGPGRVKGIYFTPNEYGAVSSKNTSIHKQYYLDAEKIAFAFGVESDKQYVDELRRRQEGVTDREEIARINKQFSEETGIDALYDWQNGWYTMLDPGKIKSADTVTYDENGDVIPLSERFNTGNQDIRYALPSEDLLRQRIRSYLEDQNRNPNAPVQAPQGPQRQFGNETSQRADDIATVTKRWLYEHSNYTPDTNQAQIERAMSWILKDANESDPDGFQTALQRVTNKRFNSQTADGQARTLATLAMAVAKGDITAQIMIADAYNKEGTTAGQTLQSRKIFRLMTPEGRVATLRKMLTDEQSRLNAKGINTDLHFSEWIYRAAAAAVEEGDFAKVRKAAAQELGEQIPSNWRDKMRSFRMLAMLANPRTHIRNIVGNMLFIPSVSIKNKLAAIGELGLDRGNKTKTLSPLLRSDIRQFAREVADQQKDNLTGEAKYNDRSLIDQNKQVFEHLRFLNTLSDWNSKALEFEDWIFLKGHFRRAFGGWMQANGYTVDQVRGDSQLMDMGVEYAKSEAQKATYRDFNKLAAVLNQASRNGGAVGFVVDAALPFKKTPANILRRGIEYSPLGLVKGITTDMYHLHQYQKAVRNNTEIPAGAKSPNQVIDDICSGLSGSMVMAAGALLASLGAVKVGLDDDDDQFDKERGEQEYAINPGKTINGLLGVQLLGENVTYTIDWAAPMSMPLFVGSAIYQQIAESGGITDAEEIANALASISEPVFNLSMLDGVNSLFKTSQYDDTNEITQIGAKILTNYASSYIPSFVGGFARTIDGNRRKAYVESGKNTGVMGTIRYAIEQAQNKIPWASMSNIPYTDVWGNTEESTVGEKILENFISPGYIGHTETDIVTDELERLYNATGDKAMIPSYADKTITLGKSVTDNPRKIALTDWEWHTYHTTRGQAAYNTLDELMQTDYYLSATEERQAEMVKEAWKYATQEGKKAVAPDYKPENSYGDDPVVTIINDMKKKDAQQIVNDAKPAATKNNPDAYHVNGMLTSLDEMDFEGYETSREALYQAGIDDKTIKSKIANQYRDQWKAAYLKDDYEEMLRIEEILGMTGYKFDFKDWRKQVEK